MSRLNSVFSGIVSARVRERSLGPELGGGVATAKRSGAALTGATSRQLMARMGHSTAWAALIYLHDSDERQRKLADGLDALLRSQLAASERSPESPKAAQSGARWGRGAVDA
jgi:hypothetical protein